MTYPRYNELAFFYGDPRFKGRPQVADPEWIRKNLILVPAPYPLFTAWDGKPMRNLRVHKRCAKDMIAALTEIGKAFTELERKRFQLDRCGGIYMHRPIRGYDWEKLSVHAYGAAIDLAVSLNPLGRRYDPARNMMPMKAVEIFLKHGAEWGGLWTRPDAQHFQFSRI